jgi:hypothetical protein
MIVLLLAMLAIAAVAWSILPIAVGSLTAWFVRRRL